MVYEHQDVAQPAYQRVTALYRSKLRDLTAEKAQVRSPEELSLLANTLRGRAYEAATAATHEAYGKWSMEAAAAHYYRARWLAELRDPDALDSWLQVLAIEARSFGFTHPETLGTWNNLGLYLCDDVGRVDAGEAFLRLAIRLKGKAHAPGRAAFQLAQCLADSGQRSRARRWAHRAARETDSNGLRGTALHTLARCAAHLGDAPAADGFYRQAIDALEGSGLGGAQQLANTYYNLARHQMAQSPRDETLLREALKLNQRALEVEQAAGLSESQRIRRALFELMTLLADWDGALHWLLEWIAHQEGDKPSRDALASPAPFHDRFFSLDSVLRENSCPTTRGALWERAASETGAPKALHYWALALRDQDEGEAASLAWEQALVGGDEPSRLEIAHEYLRHCVDEERWKRARELADLLGSADAKLLVDAAQAAAMAQELSPDRLVGLLSQLADADGELMDFETRWD